MDNFLGEPTGKIKYKIFTGVRSFTTNHNERIFYKIENDILVFIPDKLGHLKRYKKRITELLDSSIQSNDAFIEDSGIGQQEYKKSLSSLILEDAVRYILTDENEKAVTALVASRLKLANTIASLCCNEMEVERKNNIGEWEIFKRNVTPQGAPTSPVISNIVCQRLDYLLTAVAKRFGLKYSRYADDITFSSMHNVYKSDSNFIKELNRIIGEQGFTIKESKTRLQKEGYRKEVTGLVINEKINVRKRYIKQLRMWIYYWEKYGYKKASIFFLQQYKEDKGHIKKNIPEMANVIIGKLDYLKMVKGNNNFLYLNLKKRVDYLLNNTTNLQQKKYDKKNNHLDEILKTIFNEGLEIAMAKYRK